MGWLSRRGFGLVFFVMYSGAAGAAPNDPTAAPGGAASLPKPARNRSQPQLAVRGGADWGPLWAPIHVPGEYLRPDGSASVSFRDSTPSRDLIAGRLEVGAATRLPRRQGLFGRVGLMLGGSPIATRSLVVAGVPLSYPTQQMFFAFTGGVEFQFVDRLFGAGLDGGWAGTWDPIRQPLPDGLQLTKHGSSGPYARISALIRVPHEGLFGVALFAAFDAFLTYDGTLGSSSRASFGALLELDGSR